MAEISSVRQIASGRVARKAKETPERPQISESSPVGMFDSGVGGLTVFEEFTRIMPHESVIYLADTARVPYGGRNPNEIIKINKEILAYLSELGVKMVIMACGTSSAIAYPILKDKYKIPIVAMIDDGSRMALSATKNNRIGVIATAGTINSMAYQNTITAMKKDVQVFGFACPLLVPLIEGGFSSSDETKKVLKDYLKPLIKEKIDTLILGCTHYPHVKTLLKELLGDGVTIVNPAEEVAKTAKGILIRDKIQALTADTAKHRFLATGSGTSFKELGSRLLGKPIGNVEEIGLAPKLSGGMLRGL